MVPTDNLKRWLGINKRHARTPALGQRELAVLEILWQQGTLPARDVQASLGAEISLSTVQSTLERLHRKQLLLREKHGRAFVYRAAISKSFIISSLLHDIADDLTAGDVNVMVSGFIDYLAEARPEVRERLSNAVSTDEQQND